MKRKFLFLLAFLLAFAGLEQMKAQNYFQDTVWMRITDQGEGFFQVKFSDNDSIIVGQGYDNVLFFDTNTGHEIKRIPGNKEVFFLNSDRNFIKLHENKTKLEIFDSKTFLMIDSLENDGSSIGAMNISKDRKYFIATINSGNGIRIWDLTSKQIIKTKIFEPYNEPNLISTDRLKVFFNCDGSTFIITVEKKYKDNQNNTYNEIYHAIFDANTMDSTEALTNIAFYRLSNNCSKIAYLKYDPNYGVEVYDFNTKALIWKIPINGPSLTGIEFSPDDKYLVTSNGPGANLLVVWDLLTGKKSYGYTQTSFDNIDISHNGKFLIFSVGNSLKLLNTRFEGTEVEPDRDSSIIIYPNPSTGLATINFFQPLPEITTINLRGLSGNFIKELYNNLLEHGQQNINVNVNDIANGTYFINVNNSHISLNFKLIVNK
jgi:WD40 repeat protein